MSNNNSGGCAGGILHIFAAVGMLFVTCARMGDDVMRCGSAAAKFDDIGRTGSRVYYPKEGAQLSKTYTRIPESDYIIKSPEVNSNAAEADEIIIAAREENVPTVTAKRSGTLSETEQAKNALRAAKLLKDAAHLADTTEYTGKTENQQAAEQKISDTHRQLTEKFCADFQKNSSYFQQNHKDIITRAIKKTNGRNFPSMQKALADINLNIMTLENLYPENLRYSGVYKRAVIDNFRAMERMKNVEFISFASLPLAARNSGFAVFVELTGSGRNKQALMQMLR